MLKTIWNRQVIFQGIIVIVMWENEREKVAMAWSCEKWGWGWSAEVDEENRSAELKEGWKIKENLERWRKAEFGDNGLWMRNYSGSK